MLAHQRVQSVCNAYRYVLRTLDEIINDEKESQS